MEILYKRSISPGHGFLAEVRPSDVSTFRLKPTKTSRLTIDKRTKTSQLNIVNAGEESFLIVCCKNSSAAIVPLSSNRVANDIEAYSDEPA